MYALLFCASPAVTLRDSIERPEALDTGSIIMTGLAPANVLLGLRCASRPPSASVPRDYDVLNCSERTVNYLVSTNARHAAWAGLRSPSLT